MNDETKPGAWVPGAGHVALLCDLSEGDHYNWSEHAAVRDGGTVPLRTPVIVTCWADGTAPTEPTGAVGGGAGLIAAERLRQVTAEGWTPEHDAEHGDGSIAMAAASYAIHDAAICPMTARGWGLWPWAEKWWKPSDDPVKNLVRAGALIAAEIDRVNGTAPTEPAPTGLEPGEIVAVPADLKALADEIERHAAMVPPEDLRGQWENGRQVAYRSVLAWIANGIPDGAACVDARPIQNGDPR